MSNYTPGVRCITLLLTPNIVLDTVPWKPVKPLLVKISLHAPNVNFPKVFFLFLSDRLRILLEQCFRLRHRMHDYENFQPQAWRSCRSRRSVSGKQRGKRQKKKIGERFAPHSSPVFSFWNRLGGKLLFILQEDLAPQAAQANIMNASCVRLQLTEYCLE